MTDDTQALAQGLTRRDPDLLDHLIELYQRRLYRYLLFLTGNPALAEDLFQETWIRVLERGHQYNAKSKFESWLFAIARNLVIDVSRRKKMPSLEDLGDKDNDLPFDPPIAAALVETWKDVDEIFERFNGRPPCAGVIPIAEMFSSPA